MASAALSLRKRVPLLAISLVGLLFSLAYAFTNPPLESTDEPYHLATIQMIAVKGHLPNLRDPSENVTNEGHQHPLYYIVGAIVEKAITGDGVFHPRVIKNPLAQHGSGFSRYMHRRPMFLRDPENVAYYTLKVLNCIFFALLIWVVGLIAEMCIPAPFLFAAPLAVALLPQMQWVSASVSNDSLTFLMAGVALYSVLAARENGRWWLAGLCVSLAYLTKKSDFVCLVPLVLGLWPLDRCFKRKLLLALAGLVPMMLWMVRQQVTYGGFFGGISDQLATPDLVSFKSISDPYFTSDFLQSTYLSFFGMFGWMNIAIPAVLIGVATAIYAPTAIGVIAPWKGAARFLPFTCFAMLLANVFGDVLYNMTIQSPQGRLLFPSISAIGLLVAYGWYVILAKSKKAVQEAVLGLALAAMLCVDIGAWYTNLAYFQGSANKVEKALQAGGLQRGQGQP